MRLGPAGLAAAAVLLAGAARASTEPDVVVPGATGRLGLGGGWWPGAWVPLRLEATGPGSYRLVLRTEEGSLRAGLVPVTAELSVPDGPGARSAEIVVPLFGRRPARLTLEGPAGRRTAAVEPLAGTPAIVVTDRPPASVGGLALRPEDLAADPARWLAGGVVLVERAGLFPAPAAALALLAAGARLDSPGGLPAELAALEPGPVGLGAVGPGGAPRPPRLESLVETLAPEVGPPGRTQPSLGWWAGGAFALALAAYSARRADPRAAYAAGAAGVLLGLTGAWALSPRAPQDRSVRLLAGSGGWGVETVITATLSLDDREARLPRGARPLGLGARSYDEAGVSVRPGAWSALRYWTPPRAAVVPLRSTAAGLANAGAVPLNEVEVVGAGPQEPLAPAARRPVRRLWSGATPTGIARLLPEGTAVARGPDGSWFVALPEASP